MYVPQHSSDDAIAPSNNLDTKSVLTRIHPPRWQDPLFLDDEVKDHERNGDEDHVVDDH